MKDREGSLGAFRECVMVARWLGRSGYPGLGNHWWDMADFVEPLGVHLARKAGRPPPTRRTRRTLAVRQLLLAAGSPAAARREPSPAARLPPPLATNHSAAARRIGSKAIQAA